VVLTKELEGPSDAALVAACRDGDRTAFDTLVRRYKDRIYNLLYRLLGNHEDAMDLGQEVFLRAYRGLHGFQSQSQVFTWLYSIAINLARNHVRNRGRKGRNRAMSLDALEERVPGFAQGTTEERASPRAMAEFGEIKDALDACLAELAEHYRVVFVLRVFDDLSYEAIAGIAECPPGTVKSRLNQSRKLLRDCLKLKGVM